MNDRSAEKMLVKERVALADLVREVVAELQPRGGELWACCPFHAEDTPSFHVRPALGVYKCFGCGESGDVFSFVMKTRGLGFREALELLAERAGVTLGSLSPEDKRRQAQAREQRRVLEEAREQFRRALGREGRAALDYLYGRGFERETLLGWDVGYIPDDFEARLRGAGLSTAQVDGAGFTRMFGGRIGFGIRDGNGALVGFGARRLRDDEASGPKYVNTRETPAFAKGRLLYGLHQAAPSLQRARRLVVMEGYTDVMMAHQAGVTEAVATMGTSFTAEHLRLVTSRVNNLVFVFDGDEAGARAAERAVEMVLAQGRECRVVLLPDGADPCEWFAGRGREEFDDLLAEQAISTVRYLSRRALQRLDPGQPGGREAVARDVLEKTRAIADPIRRQAVTADVARECGVDRNLLARAAPGVGGVVGGDFRPRAGAAAGAPPKAVVRSQFAAVGGLAEAGGRLEQVERLASAGAIRHPGALGLLEIARGLLAGGSGPLDPMEWVEAVGEARPDLRPALDMILFPPPESLLPSYEEALTHLEKELEIEHERASRRAALSRPDIESDPSALRELDARLRARAGGGAARAVEGGGSGPGGSPTGPRAQVSS